MNIALDGYTIRYITHINVKNNIHEHRKSNDSVITYKDLLATVTVVAIKCYNYCCNAIVHLYRYR